MAELLERNESDYLIDELNGLLNLEYDSIRAYETAIRRLHNPSCRKRFEEFKQRHLRHTQVLAALVSGAGGEPAARGDVKAVLAQGTLVIGNIVGDQGVLKAMNCNERSCQEIYQQSLDRLSHHPAASQVVRDILLDERRHHDWMEQTLKSL